MNEFDRQLGKLGRAAGEARNGATRAKKVLLVASHPDSLINFRGPLIEDMRALGLEVAATAPDIDPDTRSALAALGVEAQDVSVSRKGLGLASNIGYWRALRSLMKRLRPDLVLNYTVKPNIWGSLAAGSLGIRSASMVTGLGQAFSGGRGLKGRLVGVAVRFLYRLATRRNFRVVFQNPDDCAAFIDSGCLEDHFKACLVNGSGIDIERFARAPLPDGPVFVMICRLLASKGVKEYAAAAKIVRQAEPEARFLLVGFLDDVPDGISRAELDACIADGVEFLGRKTDVRPVIAEASVSVLPSYYPEGTPRSLLEGMALGRAVVTTDMPGCRETVTEGVNGFLVAPRDPVALAEALLKLARDPDLRRRMGAESRRIAEEKYDVREVDRTLLRHLEIAP